MRPFFQGIAVKRETRQLFLSRTQQWRGTRDTVRAFVTANYDQPNPHNQSALAVPPTITTQQTQFAGLTTELRYSTGSLIPAYFGGGSLIATPYRRFPVAKIALTGGSAGNGYDATSWRAGAIITAAKVAFRCSGSTLPYRMIVNGQYVDTTGTLTATTTGQQYIQLDFGSSATRTILLEGEGSQGFDAIGIAPGDSAVTIPAARRILFLGDSVTRGTGATRAGDSYAKIAADILGVQDCWTSAIGSTGYVATGAAYNLQQRLADGTATGPWDIIVIAMGHNDRGTAAETIANAAAFCLRQIRQYNPASQIFVIGPWDNAAPSAPAADYTAAKAAILSAIPAGSGIAFLDTTGTTYTKIDVVHPDDAGHVTVGRWAALAIKNALGA